MEDHKGQMMQDKSKHKQHGEHDHHERRATVPADPRERHRPHRLDQRAHLQQRAEITEVVQVADGCLVGASVVFFIAMPIVMKYSIGQQQLDVAGAASIELLPKPRMSSATTRSSPRVRPSTHSSPRFAPRAGWRCT